jgi:hypothetical protein
LCINKNKVFTVSVVFTIFIVFAVFAVFSVFVVFGCEEGSRDRSTMLLPPPQERGVAGSRGGDSLGPLTAGGEVLHNRG